MVTYADSSFLVSVYANDTNTERAKHYLVRNPGPVLLTRFSRAESQYALRMLAFQKRLSFAEMTRALLQFEYDEAEGYYQMQSFPSEDLFEKGLQLSHRHTLEFGIRYLDLLHIAAAQLINAKRFLTFDAQQGKLAKAVGFDLKP